MSKKIELHQAGFDAIAEEDGVTVEELCSVPRPHTEIYNLSAFPMTIRLTPTTITGRNGKVIDVIE